MLNWIAWNKTEYLRKNILLNNQQMLICHKTQTNEQTNINLQLYVVNNLYQHCQSLICSILPMDEI